MIKRQLWLLLVFLISISCEREPRKASQIATSIEAIEAAQIKSLNKLNPYDVEKGQTVHKIETQEVISSQGPAKFLAKEWVTEVVQREDLSEVRLLTTNQRVVDRVLDENFVYEFKNVFALEQIEPISTQDQLNENAYSVTSIVDEIREQSEKSRVEVVGVAFENLVVKKAILVPPELVKNAKDCKSLENCRIDSDLITYDIVFQMSDQSVQRHSVEWFISDQVPFFAGILKQCATTLIPIENQRVLVKQCREVVDFNE